MRAYSERRNLVLSLSLAFSPTVCGNSIDGQCGHTKMCDHHQRYSSHPIVIRHATIWLAKCFMRTKKVIKNNIPNTHFILN